MKTKDTWCENIHSIMTNEHEFTNTNANECMRNMNYGKVVVRREVHAGWRYAKSFNWENDLAHVLLQKMELT